MRLKIIVVLTKSYEKEVKLKKTTGLTTTADIDINEILYTPLTPEDLEKLELERFRAEGIDADLKDPKGRYRQLLADSRYLANSAYANLGKKGAWKGWTKEDILKYFAACVDALRSIHIALVPPTLKELYKKEHPDKDPEQAKKTSYWRCYAESKRYMKFESPKEEKELEEWKEKRKKLLKKDEAEEEKSGEKSKKEEELDEKEKMDFLNIRADLLKDLSDKELRNLHQEGHYYWQLHEKGELKDIELLINNHVLLVQEMVRRGLKHFPVKGIDSISQRFFPGYDKKGFTLLFEHEEIHREYEEGPCDLLFLQHLESEAQLMKSGYKHIDHSDELDKYYVWHNEHSLAHVNPSGEFKGREVRLDEVLGYLKHGFRLRSPYAYLSGGIVNNQKTINDIEIVTQCTQSELDSRQGHLFKWRIMRMFPPELAGRLHFIPATHIGPVTNNIPLYALSCERINEGNDIFEMSLDEDSFEMRKALLRAKAPQAEKQAGKAKKADKITLGEFFLPMKPTRSYLPETRSTIDSFVKFFKDEDFPVYSSKKLDGARHIIHKMDSRIRIWSEDGEDNTKSLPKIIAAVKKLNARNCIIDTEIESYESGVHRPREYAAGLIHSKAIRDETLIATAFDILYYNGRDLHKIPFEERLKILKKLNFPQSTEKVPDVEKRLNLISHHLNKNRAELRKETERLRRLPYSEGNVAKQSKFVFNLKGKRSGEIKFHNNALITVAVIKKIPTKVSGVSNYQYGILVGGEKVSEAKIAEVDAKKYYTVGKTFSTARVMKPGDKFHLEFETLNATRNLATDEIRVTCWVPRFIETTNEAVDTIDSAMKKAKKERVLQLKEITEEGKTIYKMLNEEEIISKALTYEDVPNEEQKSKFMIHLHSRGKSLHSDFRVEAKDKKYIVGFTLDDSIKGGIKEPILTMAQAKALLSRKDISKINWATGKFKMRRTAADTIVPTQIRSQEKKPAPKEWLGIEGVVPKGSVGATKEFPGVFVIRDKGIAEYGTIKPYFKEFFLDGQHLKGRLVFRQLTPWTTKELDEEDLEKILPPSKGEEIERTGIWWNAIQPLDQLPYVLSDRAVKKAWVPLQNFSALPRDLKKKIPAEFHYWKKSSEKERIKIRDVYVEWLKKENKYDELRKSFDVREIEVEPREFNYWVMKEFLDCKLKDVFANSVFIPQPKLGNFLKAFQEVTKDFQTLDVRNFDKRGCEAPPVYQVIKLNSKREEDFLIEGMQFLENRLAQKYIASFFPTFGGLDFTFISNTIFKSLNKDLVKKMSDWIKENNFLKNEKFTLSGDFLEPAELEWEDLKLEEELREGILRINKTINEEKRFSRGMLFIGPPGTGKTMSCKLLMKYANSTFLWVTAKEFSPSAMGMAFNLARELAPTILCFEDIDTYITGHCVDLFKTELDGLIANEGLCVILTTNHPENLPLSLLDRPGRFHDICNFELPNSEVRSEMISHFAEEEIDSETMGKLIKETEGFSGAHIRELVTFAKRIQLERECELDEAFIGSLEKLKKQKDLVAEILENKEQPNQPFRLAFSKSEKTKCAFCGTLFSYSEEIEIAMGAVACPRCSAIIDQEGTIFGFEKISEKDARFVLQHHVFRGPKVIREGWSEQHWDIRLDIGKPELIHYVLWKSPLEYKKISAILKPCKDKKSMTMEYLPPKRGAPYSEYKERSIPFNTPANPTKQTPAFIWAEDKGEAIVLENTDTFKKIQFKGKKLKGSWAFIREDPKAAIWRVEYSAVPEPKKELVEVTI